MTVPYFKEPDFLEHVYTLADPNANYSFNDILIVRDTRDGKLWAAHDQGCSCPGPFEDYVFPTDYVEIRTEQDLDSFINGEGNIWLEADIEAAKKKIRR